MDELLRFLNTLLLVNYFKLNKFRPPQLESTAVHIKVKLNTALIKKFD